MAKLPHSSDRMSIPVLPRLETQQQGSASQVRVAVGETADTTRGLPQRF